MGAGAAPYNVPGSVLWDRLWSRQRRDAADVRRARELSQIPSRDDGLVTLRPCITAGLALTAGNRSGKGIDVLVGADGRVGRVETVRQCLQEGYDLVFLRIRQALGALRHVDVVRDLWLRPAGHPLDCAGRAVTRGDRKLKGCIPVRGRQRVSRVIEMYKLLQALDVMSAQDRNCAFR